jgi:hypothetical protein
MDPSMNAKISPETFSRATDFSETLIVALVVIAIRFASTVVFILMSMADVFIAPILGFLALSCFFVSVLFGFILRMPFEHRWAMLGASVLFVLAYVLYRAAMAGVARLMR